MGCKYESLACSVRKGLTQINGGATQAGQDRSDRFLRQPPLPCCVRCRTDAGRRSADHRFGATDSNACAYGALMKTLPALFLAVVAVLTSGASLAQSGNMMGDTWGGGWMGGYGGLWMPILLVVVVALVVLVVRRK